MNIMELGAIGELVGGVAVIGSLLYVGLKVRGSTKEQKASSLREATRATADVVQNFLAPRGAEVWLEGMRDYQALDPADRLRFSATMLHFFRAFEQLHHESRGKNLERDVWLGFERQLCDIVAYPGFAGWWEDRGHWFHGPFREFVESQMGADNPPRIYETWNQEV